MPITHLATDTGARERLAERLMERVRAQAAESGAGVTTLPAEMRDLVDRLDHVDLETLQVRQFEDDALQMGPVTTRVMWGSLAVGTGAIIAGLLGAPGLDCAITAGVAAATAGFSALARSGHTHNLESAARQLAAHETRRADLRREMDNLCARDRSTNEARLLDDLRKCGATAASAEEIQTGALGMVLLGQVERDPAVLMATQRLKKVEDVARRATAALAGDRQALFAAEPARVEATWADKSVVANGVTIASLLGSAVGIGLAAGAVIGSGATVPAALIAGGASVPLTRWLTKPLVERSVEKAMRRDIGEELQAAHAEVAPRRAALEKAQQDAVARHTDYAVTHLPATAAQQPGSVAVGDGHVTIGGVRVEVKKG